MLILDDYRPTFGVRVKINIWGQSKNHVVRRTDLGRLIFTLTPNITVGGQPRRSFPELWQDPVLP